VNVGVFQTGSASNQKGLKHVISNELSNSVKELKVESNTTSAGM
jgi:hypothetical protein